MATLSDGELLVDKNGVTWRVDGSSIEQWVVHVTRDSARTYDVSAAGEDEEPVIIKDRGRPGNITTTQEMQAEVDLFASRMKQNLVLRVRASPDAPSGGGMSAGIFWALLLVAALAAGGKRRR